MATTKKQSDHIADAYAALTVACSLAAHKKWAAADRQLAQAAAMALPGSHLDAGVEALRAALPGRRPR